MMTGMERLVAAVTGGAADRIPVFCNLFDQGARELGMGFPEYYSKGAYVAEGQLKMRERFGHDNVWGLFYVGKEAEMLGCKKIRFAKDGPPNVEDFVIKTLDDIDRLEVPDDLLSHPDFDQQRICMEILKREVGGRQPICAYITATMTLPALLMGMDKWIDLLFLGDPGQRDQLLSKCHDFFIKEVRAFRALGADVIVYSNPFGTTDFVPMKYFMNTSLPWIEKDVKAAGVDGLVYYGGMARFNDVIAAVRERTGIGAWYISPLNELAEAKEIIGSDGLTCGVINDIKLISWSPEEIREEVKRMLAVGMVGGKFLFGTGVMPYGIPEENIRTMLEAAYEFGRLDGGTGR